MYNEAGNVVGLLERIEAMLERGFLRVRVRIPFDQAALVDLFHRKGSIATERHTPPAIRKPNAWIG